MIHYHVWFNLKPGVTEQGGLSIVAAFLTELSQAGESQGYQLLKNFGGPPRSKLPAYHALIEFADSDALRAAMKQQAQRGIFNGAHGRVVEAVCDFHVEIFESIAADSRAGVG